MNESRCEDPGDTNKEASHLFFFVSELQCKEKPHHHDKNQIDGDSSQRTLWKLGPNRRKGQMSRESQDIRELRSASRFALDPNRGAYKKAKKPGISGRRKFAGKEAPQENKT